MTFIKDLGTRRKNKSVRRYWLCRCESCRDEFEQLAENVKLRPDSLCRKCASRRINTTHGDTKSRLYGIWYGMRARCNYKNRDNSKSYTDKNIMYIREWDSYEIFKDWALSNGYKDNLTIDRIDNSGNYEPSNCRWVTNLVQQRNKRLLMSTNTSGYRGVSWHKRKNKWSVSIMINYKSNFLGLFNEAIDGARAYDKYVIDNEIENPTNFKRSDYVS